MINWNKLENTKTTIYLLIFFIFISIMVIYFLLSIKIDNISKAILKIDDTTYETKITISDKNFIVSNNSNLIIKIDSQKFLLEDVAFKKISNNIYKIDYRNEELKEFLTLNHLYEIQIESGYKTIFNIIFNV